MKIYEEENEQICYPYFSSVNLKEIGQVSEYTEDLRIKHKNKTFKPKLVCDTEINETYLVIPKE
jgi:hypothetical protein